MVEDTYSICGSVGIFVAVATWGRSGYGFVTKVMYRPPHGKYTNMMMMMMMMIAVLIPA